MRKSIRLRIVGSFLFIVIIPIIIFSIFFYIYNVYNLKEKIADSRLSSFNQATIQSNYLLKELNNFALNISNNLNSFITYQNDNTLKYNDSEIVFQLTNYLKNLSPDIMTSFYIRGENKIYLGTEKIEYTQFESVMESYSDLNMSGFYQKLNSIASPVLFKMEHNIAEKNQTKGLATYMIPLPYSGTRSNSIITFLIHDMAFNSIFENSMGTFNGNIYIYNKTLKPIYSNKTETDPTNIISFSEAYPIKGTGLINKTINGKKLVIMRSISQDSDIAYIIAMEDKEFYKEAFSIKNTIILLIVILVLLCITLAIFVAYYNYKPIKNLVSVITGNDYEATNTNEFEMIKDIFIKTQEQNKTLSVRINTQYNIVNNQFLQKLLRGKCKSDEDLKYYSTLSNFNFNKANYMVIVITSYNTNNKQQFIDKMLSAGNGISLANVNFYLTEMIFEETISLICNFDTEEADPSTSRCTIATYIHEFYKSLQFNDILLGVGSTYDKLTDMNLSYLEAVSALQTAITDGKQFVFLYQDIPENKTVNNPFPIMEQSVLIEGIRNGDQQAALISLDAVINRIKNTTQSFLFTQLQCIDVINNVIKMLSQQNISIDISQFGQFTLMQSITDFRDQMLSIIIFACNEIEKKREISTTQVKRNLITFINRNFRLNDFSLEIVSESLDITKSRINTILKEELSCSFVQYITNLKMEEVKRQLRETDEKIQDIVNSVGYVDVPNFLRKFKNLEGITPGQYRQLYR